MQNTKFSYNYDYTRGRTLPYHSVEREQPRVGIKTKRRRKTKKINFRLIIFVMLLGLFILPFAYKELSNRILFNPMNNALIKPEKVNLVNESDKYITQNIFFGQRQLVKEESHIMDELILGPQMFGLQNILNNQIKAHPNIKPTIFVWEYTTGRYVSLNGEQSIPTASIIKIPVLYELFRQIDQGLISLDEKMTLLPHFVTGGSGYLQYKPVNLTNLSIAQLAALMIQTSDNTATNMLLSRIGGMDQLNRSLNLWGLKNTTMKNWLPDLTGTNRSTAKDMATLLYNIDNTNLLSLRSRTQIIGIMSKVRNTSLIKAGLPDGAQFFHKTGDIGEMLGDAGIVQMPDGRRYIIVIMVKRPWNSYEAKEFIINASRTVYNYLSAR